MIILHFFKFHRWKIIFIGHEEKACFAAYPNLENKSQKYAKSRDFWKNKESLGCTRSIYIVVVSWEKSSEVSAMFVNLARNALYLFFCGFKVLLPMNITCYYYLKVGLKETASSSSILRGREFCYVGGALSRVPKTRALKRGLRISSPRKVKNLEANNLAVCIYWQIFQPLIWTERIAVYSTNWVVRQIPKQYRINQSVSQLISYKLS